LIETVYALPLVQEILNFARSAGHELESLGWAVKEPELAGAVPVLVIELITPSVPRGPRSISKSHVTN
jgi:hypothetical protein